MAELTKIGLNDVPEAYRQQFADAEKTGKSLTVSVQPQQTEKEMDDEFYGSLSMEPVQENNFKQRLINAAVDTGNYISTTMPQSAAALTTGAATWMIGKTAAAIIGLREGLDNGGDFEAGMKEGQKIEEKINELFNYAPTDEKAQDIVNTISHLLDNFVSKPASEVGQIAESAWTDNPVLQAAGADKLAPWIKFIAQFGTELAIFKGAHEVGKIAGEKIDTGISKVEQKLSPKQKADIISDYIQQGKTPEQAIIEKTVNESTAKPEEFFAKSAEESAKFFREQEDKKTQTYAVNSEEFKPLTSEEKQALQEARQKEIAESSKVETENVNTAISPLEAKLQDIDSMIEDIKKTGEEIGYGKLRGTESIKTEGSVEQGIKIRQPQITEEQSSKLATQVNELNRLREVAETSTGMNLKGFYDNAVDSVLNQLPEKSSVIVKSKYADIKSKRFISEETYQAAKQRFDASAKRLHSGVDPEMIKDMIVIGAYHIETGFRKFGEWSDLMVKQYGEQVKPHLEEVWNKSQTYFKDEIINKTSQKLQAESADAKIKPRKFLQTIQESDVTSEPVKEGVKGIEPQDYIVQPNKESLGKADARIGVSLEQAENYVKSTTPVDAEKGATFVSLIKKYQNEASYDKAVDMIENFDRQLRESGRFIQTASIWNRLTPEGFLRWAEKEVEKVNTKTGVIDAMFGRKKVSLSKKDRAFILGEKNRIEAMPDGIEKTNELLGLMDYVARKVPPTASELIDAYRYQNMLSGWQTQERNIGENLFNTAITRPFDLGTKAMNDYIEAGLFGKERQAYVSDVPLYYKHVLNAVPNAIDAFKAVWKGTDTAFGKPELGLDQYKTEFEKARFKQMPKYLTVVQRFMEASDKFNSTLISAGEYAVRLKNGETPEQAYQGAKALAETYLYRNRTQLNSSELSALSKMLADLEKVILDSRKLPAIGKPMSWVIPFIKTPINKGIAMIEHSPLALLRTKGFSSEVRAKIVSGSIMTAIGAVVAYQGQTTWATPSDPKLKEMFYATGRKPFSVKIGDKWVPYWYLGPFAMAFALPAAVKYYTEDQKKALSADQFDKLIDISSGIARFIGSQTSTQSIGAFFNMLSGDIDYTLPGQLGFTAEQLIPVSGMLRNVNKILDPVYRDPEGFWEPIKKDLPYLSQDIPAYTKPMGEESKREWWNALLPYEFGKEDAFYNIFYEGLAKEKQIQSLSNDFQKKLEKGKLTDKDIDEFYNKLSESYLEQ